MGLKIISAVFHHTDCNADFVPGLSMFDLIVVALHRPKSVDQEVLLVIVGLQRQQQVAAAETPIRRASGYFT